MKLRDAFCKTVHEVGVANLAARMGVNPSTLQQKANPNAERHAPTVADLEQVALFAGRPYIADAIAALAGGVFTKLGQFEGVSDTALLEVATKLGQELGSVFGALNEALADGDVTSNEVEKIRSRVYTLNQASAELVNRVEGMVRQPKHLKVVG